ncbi:hypothetical protein Q3157_18835 [Clostridioides difficile]
MLSLFWGFILTMWYVNVIRNGKTIKRGTSFILTMWYVNVKDKANTFKARKCFILTMWYVNARVFVFKSI